MDALVISWWFVVGVEGSCLLYEVMPLILKPLPDSDLSCVQTLPVMAIDGLRGRRPVTRGGGKSW